MFMQRYRKGIFPVISIIAVMVLCAFATVRIPAAHNFEERNNYGAKLEPTNKVLHGAGQCNWNGSVLEYRQALQYKYDPVMVNDFLNVKITNTNADKFANSMRIWLAKFPNFTVLQLALNLGASNTEGGPFIDLTQGVANGAFDGNLSHLFRALSDLNVPIYIRIGSECNGSWNPYATNSYQKAFARVSNLLRASILSNNAAIVWCIAANGSSQYMKWYPGSQYMDWWAIDLFPASSLTSSLTNDFLNSAHANRKPVMIGESSAAYVGVANGQASWDVWFKPYFELIRNRPGIKAFNYINWDWRKYPQWASWGDCRIGQNTVVSALYAQEMASPLYLHASTRQAFADSMKPGVPKSFVIR